MRWTLDRSLLSTTGLGLTTIVIGLAVGLATFGGPPSLDAAEDTDDVSVASETGEPFGVHLSVVDDDPTTMTVTWYTNNTADPGTQVHYGSSCDNLSSSADGSSFRLTLDPGTRVHSAQMVDLEPGQTFAYEVRSGSHVSECFEASALPDGDQLNFAVYGDQGVDQGAHDVHDQIEKRIDELDLILIAGDLTYAEGDQGQWDEWVLMNQDLFTKVPMMGAPGNHEAATPIGMDDFREHLTQPGAEVYYSFDAANVHFVVFNSDIDQARFEGHFQDMMQFVENDLQQASEAKQAGEIDHIMFLQHHAIYSDASHGDNTGLMALQEHWFHRYDAKFLFVGHDHVYERSHPMVYEQPTTTDGPTYDNPRGWIEVVTGGGGDGLYSFQGDPSPWIAAKERVYHYTDVSVDGDTVTAQAIEAAPDAGELIDEFTLIDSEDQALVPPPQEPPAVLDG